MTSPWRALILPAVLLPITLLNLIRSAPLIAGGVDAWWPPVAQLALALVGGAVLAFGAAYAIYRRERAR